jgi:hypothetical protein
MDEDFFDNLAKGLEDGSVSRRRALKLAGGALLAAVVPPLFPRQAGASSKARRRCRRKGDIYMSQKGICHCTPLCNTPNSGQFSCNGNTNCTCRMKTSGFSFCAAQRFAIALRCLSDEDCSGANSACVVLPGCSGGACTSSTQCSPNSACINGTCQLTACVNPCPPS